MICFLISCRMFHFTGWNRIPHFLAHSPTWSMSFWSFDVSLVLSTWHGFGKQVPWFILLPVKRLAWLSAVLSSSSVSKVFETIIMYLTVNRITTHNWKTEKNLISVERCGAVVKRQTRDREVPGSIPTNCKCCFLEQETLSTLLSTGFYPGKKRATWKISTRLLNVLPSINKVDYYY